MKKSYTIILKSIVTMFVFLFIIGSPLAVEMDLGPGTDTKPHVRLEVPSGPSIYLPFNLTVVAGVQDSGNVTSIMVARDGDTLNVSEANGVAPVLDVIVNFTGVGDFSTLIGRWYYNGGGGHVIKIGIFDYNDGTYEEEYGEITDMSGFEYVYITVLDAPNHISGGNVSVKFRHVNNGVTSHDLFLDYLALMDSSSGGSISLTTITGNGNLSFNESHTDGLYALIGAGGNASWNESHADGKYALIGAGGNASWNESHANTLYENISTSGSTMFKFSGSKFMIKVTWLKRW